ncbi:MAG: hypothetical protein BWY82_01973 [Verrucomicrobia bacterium ADurb.Bin474]|nr:MAG: hypothetical protein BWY82_01973 [Verrucomicrobia bacterium ADurb.Bin474]
MMPLRFGWLKFDQSAVALPCFGQKTVGMVYHRELRHRTLGIPALHYSGMGRFYTFHHRFRFTIHPRQIRGLFSHPIRATTAGG